MYPCWKPLVAGYMYMYSTTLRIKTVSWLSSTYTAQMASRSSRKKPFAHPPDPGGPSRGAGLKENERSSHDNPVEITPRPYQLELLESAISDNTIVNLGTGAGKTFIAVMLIRELSHEILDSFSDTGAKRTIFLVNTGKHHTIRHPQIYVRILVSFYMYYSSLLMTSDWLRLRVLNHYWPHPQGVCFAMVCRDEIKSQKRNSAIGSLYTST